MADHVEEPLRVAALRGAEPVLEVERAAGPGSRASPRTLSASAPEEARRVVPHSAPCRRRRSDSRGRRRPRASRTRRRGRRPRRGPRRSPPGREAAACRAGRMRLSFTAAQIDRKLVVRSPTGSSADAADGRGRRAERRRHQLLVDLNLVLGGDGLEMRLMPPLARIEIGRSSRPSTTARRRPGAPSRPVITPPRSVRPEAHSTRPPASSTSKERKARRKPTPEGTCARHGWSPSRRRRASWRCGSST